MTAAVPTEQSHQRERGSDQSPVRVEQFTVHTVPEEMRAYLLCRAVDEQSSLMGEMEVVAFESLSDADCAAELEIARSGLLTNLRRQDAAASPAMTDALVGFYISIVEELPSPASVAFASPVALASDAYTVPDGMWEYHLCMSASPVYLNGERAEPRFLNDLGCEQSRAYSRDEAVAHLERVGEPRSAREREELVEQYIREIDARIPSRDAEP